MTKQYYVLKDKKHGSYVGTDISYVASVKDARKFNAPYDAKDACLSGRVGRSSLLTGGLELILVTEEPGTPKIRALAEFDIGKPTDTIKYVVKEGGYYLNASLNGYYAAADQATQFDTQAKAIGAISARSLKHGYAYECIVVRIAISAGDVVYTEKLMVMA